MKPLAPTEALALAQRWDSIATVGRSDTPLVVVDLRGLSRSFRQGEQDEQLRHRLSSAPWVNVAIVDDGLDEVFAPLADGFDVIIGDGTESLVAVDVADDAGVAQVIDELEAAVTASPQASVALAQLLRLTHDVEVAQALHGESLTYAMLQSSDTFQRWLASRNAARQHEVVTERAVLTELTGSLLRITLNRPERRNALNIAMRDQLAEALELLDLDPSIDGAVLTGAGSNFSAGGDLDEFGSTPSPAAGHHVRSIRSIPALLHRLATRVRVHVHGSCVGAGIELPAFCDSIIAHPDTTFRLPEIAFGLVPGAGGTVSITRRCGRHRAAWLALTGQAIDAEHALRWRLIDRIDPSVFPPT